MIQNKSRSMKSTKASQRYGNVDVLIKRTRLTLWCNQNELLHCQSSKGPRALHTKLQKGSYLPHIQLFFQTIFRENLLLIPSCAIINNSNSSPSMNIDINITLILIITNIDDDNHDDDDDHDIKSN